MIHLDTNYLIGLVTVPSPFQAQLVTWLNAGEKFAVSAVAWSEFLNGPATPQQMRDASVMLQGRIIPFGVAEAETASRLFNQTGRKRGSAPDCYIAATAICLRTPLATHNRKHFVTFVALGLRLA